MAVSDFNTTHATEWSRGSGAGVRRGTARVRLRCEPDADNRPPETGENHADVRNTVESLPDGARATETSADPG